MAIARRIGITTPCVGLDISEPMLSAARAGGLGSGNRSGGGQARHERVVPRPRQRISRRSPPSRRFVSALTEIVRRTGPQFESQATA
jgi:hypothetical protein